MTVSYDGMPPDEYDEEFSDDELLWPVRAARIAQVEREDADATLKIHLVKRTPDD